MTRFGPLWLSPSGAHMFDFTRVPWVHFLFPEKVVLRVRAKCFRPDQVAERYEDIVGHLNRITVRGFRQYAGAAGFRVRAFRVNPEKEVKWKGMLHPLNSALNLVPFLNELLSFSRLAVLDRPDELRCEAQSMACREIVAGASSDW